MDTPYYDLHNHTACSYDAYGRPADFFARASHRGVRAVAITEHNNIDSMAEAMRASADYPDVMFVPGIELTVRTDLGPVDMLLYFPRVDVLPLAELIEIHRQRYQASDQQRVDALRAIGHEYDLADLRRRYAETYPGRRDKVFGVSNQVMVKVLIEDGLAGDEGEARAVLMRMNKAVPSPAYPDVATSMPAMAATEAVRVLAHPGAFFSEHPSRLDYVIDALGLHGLEVHHKTNRPADRAVLMETAAKRGLVVTGGSDCHEIDTAPETFATQSGTREEFDAFMAVARDVSAHWFDGH